MLGIFWLIPVIVFLLSALAVVGIIALKIYIDKVGGGQGTEPVRLPYRKKSYLLTPSERKCYEALLEVLPPGFTLFPQLNIDKIIYTEIHRYEHINRIDRKSVDFIICRKEYLTPTLAVELDDPTHLREERITRDEFVNRVFASAGLKLLRIHNSDLQDKSKLKQSIAENLGISHPSAPTPAPSS